jgi:hypothetical protein
MLNALGLVFVTLEFLFALVALKSFKSFERNE